MEKFIITGGKPLQGMVTLQGAKNVALKAFVAALLTDEQLVLHNVPKLRDVFAMLEILEELGVSSFWADHTVTLQCKEFTNSVVPLDVGARLRTSSLVIGPLLVRSGKAMIPNPGGCRLGVRPIDRHIKAIREMGATIEYDSSDGYFHASASQLQGTTVTFEKVTHTGTEAVLLAAVKAQGRTVIQNAAQEVEIDDLIILLNSMGAIVQRTKPDEITVQGVSSLHGTTYTIMPDRNEEVTWAIAAVVTKGSITVLNSERKHLLSFLEPFKRAGGKVFETADRVTTYSYAEIITPVDITTTPHPGFMTDWQAPWALLMTQANGISTLHETVFESRFSYVNQLEKMGANIEFYSPEILDPHRLYNFNWEDKVEGAHQAIKINGPTQLHNAVVDIDDIRAGATVILAAVSAEGESYIYRAETVDRGYEAIEEKLKILGAHIVRETEDSV